MNNAEDAFEKLGFNNVLELEHRRKMAYNEFNKIDCVGSSTPNIVNSIYKKDDIITISFYYTNPLHKTPSIFQTDLVLTTEKSLIIQKNRIFNEWPVSIEVHQGYGDFDIRVGVCSQRKISLYLSEKMNEKYRSMFN